MQRKIIEFFLGASTGVIVLMTFAYMSVEIHNIGPVIVERVADPQPSLMLETPELAHLEQSPILKLVLPQPAAAAELLP